jgi:hypothetical protein
MKLYNGWHNSLTHCFCMRIPSFVCETFAPLSDKPRDCHLKGMSRLYRIITLMLEESTSVFPFAIFHIPRINTNHILPALWTNEAQICAECQVRGAAYHASQLADILMRSVFTQRINPALFLRLCISNPQSLIPFFLRNVSALTSQIAPDVTYRLPVITFLGQEAKMSFKSL